MRSVEPSLEFEALFDRLWRKSVRLAERLVGTGDAEDVAVEAFARALERWERVRRLPHLDAWMLRVTTNAALDTLRRTRRTVSVDRAEVVSPLDTVALRLALGEALRRLPRRQSEVIVLRYLAQLSEPEVAAALGISLGTVKTHARRGVATLRHQLGATREELFHVG